jgi:hypothetical protein
VYDTIKAFQDDRCTLSVSFKHGDTAVQLDLQTRMSNFFLKTTTQDQEKMHHFSMSIEYRFKMLVLYMT